MMTDIALRNYRSVEHRLVATLYLIYFLMFSGELIRNLAAIEYSPLISSVWFSSLGLLSLCVALHYIMNISKLSAKLPKWLSPYIFYTPVIAILINIISGAQLFSTQQFVQQGMWIFPIYDSNYYMTMTGSVIVNFIIITPLLFTYRKASVEQKRIYRSLIQMFILIAACNAVLGYAPLPDFMPPYAYIYAGLIFCIYLRNIMKSTEFLQQYDKRYEKLFEMNPDAIFLLDQQFQVRELNPVAKAFLEQHETSFNELYATISQQLKEIVTSGQPMKDVEFTLAFDDYEYDLIMNIDYVSIDLELHTMLIFRNITALKAQQREIEFMAYHDMLTKLPNRRYFYEKIDDILKHARLNEEIITIYVLDINNLKMLNDVIGHKAGDESIQMLANILSKAVGDDGIAARIGGDEFIACINETKSAITPDRFIKYVQNTYHHEVAVFKKIPVGTSIGYSQFPTHGDDIHILAKAADEAMYKMKKLKKFQYR